MFPQRVTRSGVLRQLHVNNGFSRPRVIDVQNQLRQLYLSARPIAKLSPAGTRIASLDHTHSYRTKAVTSEDEPKKVTKKVPKKAAAAKKPAKPKSKPLTEEQKEKKKQKQLKEREKKKKQEAREDLAELKRIALDPPSPLPITGWRVAIAAYFPKFEGTNSEKFTSAIAAVKALPEAELESFREQSDKNIATNGSNLSTWLKQFTPKQILEANNARSLLTRRTGKQWRKLKDDRLVKKPRNSYSFFMTEHKDDYPEKVMSAVASKLGPAWNNLSDAEKEPYVEMMHEDQARYAREYKEVYGEDPPAKKADKLD